MSLFFDRVVKVSVGPAGAIGREWSDLRIGFSVEKTSTPEPNKAEAFIFNLSQDSIGYINQVDNILQISAGYAESGAERIFIGDITNVETSGDGADLVCRIEAGDGEKQFRTARVNKNYSKQVGLGEVVKYLASTLGLGSVNVAGDIKLPYGISLIGTTRQALDHVTKSLGLEWSIQNNLLRVDLAGELNGETAALLSPGSGLIGSPSRSVDSIKLTCLLNTRIQPRSKVVVEAKGFDGEYRVDKCRHFGDNGYDSSFYTEIEGVQL